VVKELIERGAVLEARDAGQRTPLAIAASGGHLPVVKELLESGAVLEARDVAQRTPLAIAARNGHAPVANLLLERGAVLETRDVNQSTPLIIAAAGWRHATAITLLAHGADPNARDDGTYGTPIEAAKRHKLILAALKAVAEMTVEDRKKWAERPAKALLGELDWTAEDHHFFSPAARAAAAAAVVACRVISDGFELSSGPDGLSIKEFGVFSTGPGLVIAQFAVRAALAEGKWWPHKARPLAAGKRKSPHGAPPPTTVPELKKKLDARGLFSWSEPHHDELAASMVDVIRSARRPITVPELTSKLREEPRWEELLNQEGGQKQLLATVSNVAEKQGDGPDERLVLWDTAKLRELLLGAIKKEEEEKAEEKARKKIKREEKEAEEDQAWLTLDSGGGPSAYLARRQANS